MEVLVEFEYDAEQEDELTIRVGDVIKNVQMSEGGWWEGELNGKKGLFPDNFVKVLEKKKEEPKKELLVTQQRSSVKELASKLKDVHVGAAPQKKKDHHHTEKKRRAKVLFDYDPENEDELRIEVGDVVEVIKQEEEGWWEGIVNGKSGVFPSNFVEIVEEGESMEVPDTPPEEKHEVKGKKIMGIGLGNIFEGGPIKLRSTAASTKRPVERPEPKPPVTEEPAVFKREKPVMHAYHPPVLVPRKSQVNFSNIQHRKVFPVPTPRCYPVWSQRDNGHSPPLKYRPDYASADTVDEKSNDLHHAYQRDGVLEQIEIKHLVRSSDPCIPHSVGSARITEPCIPLSGGLVLNTAIKSTSYHVQPIINMFERKHKEQDVTVSSLDDSNKENTEKENRQKSLQKQSQMKRKAAQSKLSILSRLKFLPFKTRKLEHTGQTSKSETECNLEFSPVSGESLGSGQCRSVPVLHSKCKKENLIEEREPLRPIALQDIINTDPQGYPYMSPCDYRPCTPEHDLDLDSDDQQDLPCQNTIKSEPTSTPAQPSTAKHSSLTGQEGTRKLSPFVSTMAEKYSSKDWKDRRWKKYVDMEHGIVSPPSSIKANQNWSNNALQDEVSTISMFFEKASPEKTLQSKSLGAGSQKVSKSEGNMQREVGGSNLVRKSMSFQDGRRYSKEVDQIRVDNSKKTYPTTFITAAEVYKNLHPEKSIIPEGHVDKQRETPRKVDKDQLDMSNVKTPKYLEETFSDPSALEEDPLSTSLEGLEKFIRSNVAESITSTCDSDQACHLAMYPWVSPPPTHTVENAYYDEHIHKFQSMSGTDLTEEGVLEDFDSKLSAYCNNSETELEADEALQEKKGDVYTSLPPEMLSYEPSLDHSDCDTPLVTPTKRFTRPRYSSSPANKAEHHEDYDLEGTAENGLNLQVVGKKIRIIGDAQVEKDYDIVGTNENGIHLEVVGQKVRLCIPEEEGSRRTKKRKHCLIWKRLFKLKGPAPFLSCRRTDETESPLQGKSTYKAEQSSAARESPKVDKESHEVDKEPPKTEVDRESSKTEVDRESSKTEVDRESSKTKVVDENNTAVNVVFRPEDVILGTVESVFCHDFSDDEELARDSSTKIQSQSNESQTSQRLVPKESLAACDLVHYSMEDMVKELEDEGKNIEREFLRIVTDNAPEYLDMESDCRIDNPHSLMYLAGMACSKKYQLLYNSDMSEDCDVRASGDYPVNVQSNSGIDLVCGKLDFIKDDFSEPSRSEDTFDEEIDQDICPDSPGLIASMTRDVQNLNLTQSPNSSDADIARRIDSFLRDALKPIDDFTFRNDTSDDDLYEDGKENLRSRGDDRVLSDTLYSSPSAASEDPKYSMEGEEEECSALNKSFTTEDSEIDQSVKEALEEVEGVTPVMLDHQLQETESSSSSSDDDGSNDIAEDNEEEDDDDNTNNNFHSTDANENAKIGSHQRYPTFSLMSPSNERNDKSTTYASEETQADASCIGYDLHPSVSDTRSINTTGSDKFYTDIDSSMDTSTDTAKFFTDRDTDLDNTMEDGSEALRWKSPSPGSPANKSHDVIDWSMDDSIVV
ncbi:uncharacterized protein LOC125675051 isoform X2 [Ostrea edulis]|uniref:uncharacterized protein LOC125675051 isoform X2 n=1 Tax=Ostrea edulis TaxID=37623 RepID=UPI0024AF4D10|nr:uncharacterized protein LOC125675051 isoform X2 [Ostrea edulis]